MDSLWDVMPNLSIKNVPEDVVGKLRERASAHHRSLQGELLAVVTHLVGGTGAGIDEASASRVRAGHKSIEQIAAEHRARLAQPLAKGGLSVDMIRADRDGR